MLEIGIFGGKYMTNCQNKSPKNWLKNAKLCHELHNPKLNFFEINASRSLLYWQKKGWIHPVDPRGWFQWYFPLLYGQKNTSRRSKTK